jgi:CBS domain containing-hemolysin-like protein
MAILLRGFIIAGLIAFNAFFAAAEYALLSVRRTRVEQLAREGNAAARYVQTLLADIGLLISGTQLGMTVISLLMGWLGEEMMAEGIASILEGRLQPFTTVVVAHSISVGISFLLITILLMVLGELVPKALAYERSEFTALLLARPILVYLQLTRPLVRAVNGLADIVLRGLGQSPGQAHGGQHTPEEAKLIVSAIRKRGMLREEQEEMIHSVFDLDLVQVREIMVPRPKITCLALTKDLPSLLERVVEDQHSRIPIYTGAPDHIIGILNTKDLLRVALDRRQKGVALDSPFDMRTILHTPMIVPETMSLNQMLKEARRKHSQLALVVDEFGTFLGLVTIEDVLEQIVGDIQDEYDREEKAVYRIGVGVFEVDASINLRDLAEDYEVDLPRDAGYATLAGFVLARLGVIPQGGESFIYEGRRYTVLEMDGRRVAKVKVEKLPTKSAAPVAAGAPSVAPMPAQGKPVGN